MRPEVKNSIIESLVISGYLEGVGSQVYTPLQVEQVSAKLERCSPTSTLDFDETVPFILSSSLHNNRGSVAFGRAHHNRSIIVPEKCSAGYIDYKGCGFLRSLVDDKASMTGFIKDEGLSDFKKAWYTVHDFPVCISSDDKIMGLADLETELANLNASARLQDEGIDVVHDLQIYRLNELIYKGDKLSVQELKAKEIIPSEFIPCVTKQGMVTPFRLFEGNLYNRLFYKPTVFAEKATKYCLLTAASDYSSHYGKLFEFIKQDPEVIKYIDDYGIISLEELEYALDMGKFIGYITAKITRNVARMHTLGIKHGFLTSHNICLDGSLIDIDGYTEVDVASNVARGLLVHEGSRLFFYREDKSIFDQGILIQLAQTCNTLFGTKINLKDLSRKLKNVYIEVYRDLMSSNTKRISDLLRVI